MSRNTRCAGDSGPFGRFGRFGHVGRMRSAPAADHMLGTASTGITSIASPGNSVKCG